MQITLQHNKSFEFAHSLTLILGTRAKALAPQLKRSPLIAHTLPK
jgi:hypothetical protein